jgi:hypothetical protein
MSTWVASRLAAFIPICSPQMMSTVLPVFVACSAKKNAEPLPVDRFTTQAELAAVADGAQAGRVPVEHDEVVGAVLVRVEPDLVRHRQQVLLALPGVDANTQRNDGFAEQKPAGTGKVLIPTARMSGVGDCSPRPPRGSSSGSASRAYASFWAVPTPGCRAR